MSLHLRTAIDPDDAHRQFLMSIVKVASIAVVALLVGFFLSTAITK